MVEGEAKTTDAGVEGGSSPGPEEKDEEAGVLEAENTSSSGSGPLSVVADPGLTGGKDEDSEAGEEKKGGALAVDDDGSAEALEADVASSPVTTKRGPLAIVPDSSDRPEEVGGHGEVQRPVEPEGPPSDRRPSRPESRAAVATSSRFGLKGLVVILVLGCGGVWALWQWVIPIASPDAAQSLRNRLAKGTTIKSPDEIAAEQEAAADKQRQEQDATARNDLVAKLGAFNNRIAVLNANRAEPARRYAKIYSTGDNAFKFNLDGSGGTPNLAASFLRWEKFEHEVNEANVAAVTSAITELGELAEGSPVTALARAAQVEADLAALESRVKSANERYFAELESLAKDLSGFDLRAMARAEDTDSVTEPVVKPAAPAPAVPPPSTPLLTVPARERLAADEAAKKRAEAEAKVRRERERTEQIQREEEQRHQRNLAIVADTSFVWTLFCDRLGILPRPGAGIPRSPWHWKVYRKNCPAADQAQFYAWITWHLKRPRLAELKKQVRGSLSEQLEGDLDAEIRTLIEELDQEAMVAFDLNLWQLFQIVAQYRPDLFLTAREVATFLAQAEKARPRDQELVRTLKLGPCG